ncbi:MAG: diacylglycerol/polyprenol kinase family protein [Candidatus Heimdallarchaeota archaeon]
MNTEEVVQDQFKSELRRKSFHLLVLILPLSVNILHEEPRTRTALIIGGAFLTGFLLVIEALRLQKPSFFANRFAREVEREKIAAYIATYFAGYFIFLSYGLKIAAISIFVSALGDAAAALIGIRYGSHLLPFTKKKSLEGAAAGFSVTLLVCLLYAKFWLALTVALIMVATDFIEEPNTFFISDNFLNPYFFAILFYLAPHWLR